MAPPDSNRAPPCPGPVRGPGRTGPARLALTSCCCRRCRMLTACRLLRTDLTPSRRPRCLTPARQPRCLRNARTPALLPAARSATTAHPQDHPAATAARSALTAAPNAPARRPRRLRRPLCSDSGARRARPTTLLPHACTTTPPPLPPAPQRQHACTTTPQPAPPRQHTCTPTPPPPPPGPQRPPTCKTTGGSACTGW